ncbi:hypothetical protein [Bradyrhizobium cajani]|uniref:Beta-lactamase-related domain-containing protein n=1 Tax=Bradyrhizobium cajani TaxID=1928661 RepID=A0A844T4J2_9BRAD|nr:hypothetical protein [Bradyrhizobium cajani]MCP3373759.1 hypothetical protein [Bradyrhizobium cajani]MVT72545.1 hypothetical protein [Bradyrhizobium cajani]
MGKAKACPPSPEEQKGGHGALRLCPPFERARRDYGYHWYMGDFATAQPLHWFGGIGWGGQHLYVIPARDLIFVIHCGNYGRSGQEQAAVLIALLKDVVLPSFG